MKPGFVFADRFGSDVSSGWASKFAYRSVNISTMLQIRDLSFGCEGAKIPQIAWGQASKTAVKQELFDCRHLGERRVS